MDKLKSYFPSYKRSPEVTQTQQYNTKKLDIINKQEIKPINFMPTKPTQV